MDTAHPQAEATIKQHVLYNPVVRGKDAMFTVAAMPRHLEPKEPATLAHARPKKMV